MNIRIDKYLWCVRLAKTRSKATEMIQKGKIKLNGEGIKPSREVKVGDTISVFRQSAEFTFLVKSLLDRRVGSKLVEDYVLETTSSEELAKYQEYQLAQKSYRVHGTGKPSKKDRRDLDDFLLDFQEE